MLDQDMTREHIGALTVNEFWGAYRVGRNTFYNEQGWKA